MNSGVGAFAGADAEEPVVEVLAGGSVGTI